MYIFIIYFIPFLCYTNAKLSSHKTIAENNLPAHFDHGDIDINEFYDAKKWDVLEGLPKLPKVNVDINISDELKYVLKLLLENAPLRFSFIDSIIQQELGINDNSNLIDLITEEYCKTVSKYAEKLNKYMLSTKLDKEDVAMDMLDYGTLLAYNYKKFVLDELCSTYQKQASKANVSRARYAIKYFSFKGKEEDLSLIRLELKFYRNWPSFMGYAKDFLHNSMQLSDNKFDHLVNETLKCFLRADNKVQVIVGSDNFDTIAKKIKNEPYSLVELKKILLNVQRLILRRNNFQEADGEKDKTVASRILFNMIDKAFDFTTDSEDKNARDFFWEQITPSIKKWKYYPVDNIDNIIEGAVSNFVNTLYNAWDKSTKLEVKQLINILMGYEVEPDFKYLLKSGSKFLNINSPDDMFNMPLKQPEQPPRDYANVILGFGPRGQ